MQAVQQEAIKVIDVDTHLSEPHDLWTKRAPAKLRDRVPQVKMLDGVISWVIDGDKSIGIGASPASTVLKNGEKIPGLKYRSLTMDEVHPGSSQMKARVELMDANGVWAQIIYPNVLGFGGQRSAKVDPELRLASVQIYNDAVAEMQADSNQRIFPMALLPWWDINQAVAETRRCADMGLRGININSDPHNHQGLDGQMLPDLGDRYWDPLWEICVDRSLPVNFHIGASEQTMDWFGNQGWPSLSEDARGALGGSMLHVNNGRVMANLIYSGLLDRFPKLRFVSVESGIGWIPFVLESLDYQHREIVLDQCLERTPSEYFQSNFHACFWFERRIIAESIRQVGVDNVLFETDFPHPTCLYPITQKSFEVPGLTFEERRKVLSGNAAKLYNIPIS